MEKKVSFFLILFMLFSGSIILSAENLSAVITQVSGKVEIKGPSGSWKPAKEGDTVKEGDSISTGFNSKAVLETTDKSSVIVVKQLTRLSLKELLKKEGSVKTDLFLDVGSVRAQVNSTDDLKQDFSVRTASTTASVRGTVLDVVTLGDNAARILAWQGMADVVNKSGNRTNVGEAKSGDKKEKEQDKEDNQLPPPPPADLSNLPAIAGGNGGQIISGTQVGINELRINPGTRPAGAGGIALRGGGSIGNVNLPIGGQLPSLPPLPQDFAIPVDIIIEIEWPQIPSLPTGQ
ncbi:FecR domain-containing protein [Spirochaetia bacterium 38H-sp]|uniref:FecR domain-containing protein n=1 Tax=Rarispira pelagica TaxID=3141764 RepID=A0ABU9UDJ4_9SPIR